MRVRVCACLSLFFVCLCLCVILIAIEPNIARFITRSNSNLFFCYRPTFTQLPSALNCNSRVGCELFIFIKLCIMYITAFTHLHHSSIYINIIVMTIAKHKHSQDFC